MSGDNSKSEEAAVTTRTPTDTWLGRDAQTPSGMAWTAVRQADYEELEATLERHGVKATGTAQGPIGHAVTPLCAAAARGDTRAVSILIEAGADTGVKASGHMVATPMSWAIEADSLGCVLLLAKAMAKAKIGEPEDEDWCDLAIVAHDYIAHPDPEILRALLNARANPTQGALCRSIAQGVEAAVEVLLVYGADPNRTDERTGNTPLGWCVSTLGGAPDQNDGTGPRILKLLLDRDADPNGVCGEPRRYQPTVLIAALEAGSAWAVRRLIEAGANLDAARTHVRQHGMQNHADNAARVVEALRLIV